MISKLNINFKAFFCKFNEELKLEYFFELDKKPPYYTKN